MKTPYDVLDKAVLLGLLSFILIIIIFGLLMILDARN